MKPLNSYITTIFFLLTAVCFGQSVSDSLLAEFVRTTAFDYFQDTAVHKAIYVLPVVSDQKEKNLFELENTLSQDNRFVVQSERKFKRNVPVNTEIYIRYAIIDLSKSDTISVNFESYIIETSKFLFFRRTRKYWVCKGSFPQYHNGLFVFNQTIKSWDFESGRQKLQNWMDESIERLRKK